MAQFKVGGSVVALEDRTYRTLLGTQPFGGGLTIKKGEVFTVIAISTCMCGGIRLDVGFRSDTGKTSCHKCGRIRPNGGARFVRSTSFAPIEEQQFKQVVYTKIIDEIPACAQ